MAVKGWMPRRWSEELAGCLWLPRLLDKGRRRLESQRQGQDLMNGYLFGNNDYADGKLLRFLQTDDERVLELLRETDDDSAVAQTLLRKSGRSSEEIHTWHRRFRRMNRPFIAMWDADEGRREPGVGTRMLDIVYNYGLMPPVYLSFRIVERLRGWRAA